MSHNAQDPAALRAALQQAEALLSAKDQEIAAKEEIIVLLREKVRELEHAPRHEYDFLAALRGQDGPAARPKAPQTPRKHVVEEPPKSAWARFYKWFREA